MAGIGTIADMGTQEEGRRSGGVDVGRATLS